MGTRLTLWLHRSAAVTRAGPRHARPVRLGSWTRPVRASGTLIGTASRPAGRSYAVSSVSRLPPWRPEAIACRESFRATARKSRRVHEEMDWGAAARKRTTATCPVRTDRSTPQNAPSRTLPDRQLPRPVHALTGCRGNYVPSCPRLLRKTTLPTLDTGGSFRDEPRHDNIIRCILGQ